MDVIEIRGLRVRTEVGFSVHEIGKLQELYISIKLGTSITKAGRSDCVDDSINYKTVNKEILRHVENKTYNLIETVATDVARICVVRHNVPWVKVTVEKPNALRFTDLSSVAIERRREDFDPGTFHVSVGSNIQPLTNIHRALRLLANKVDIIKVSEMFVTTPVGFKEQADFVNMAALVRTRLHPEGLKQVLADVEQYLGRIRDPNNNSGPRTIDLDLSLWEDNVLQYKHTHGTISKICSIPEPDSLKHAHVIIPLADVTPEFVHPQVKKPLRVIAEEVSGRANFKSFFPTVKQSALHSDETCIFATKNSKPESHQKLFTQMKQSKVEEHAVESTDPSIGALGVNRFPVALITGAAKRLGASITRKLHCAGYNVLVHYNTSVLEAKNLVEELNSTRTNSAELIQGDLIRDISSTADRVVKNALKVWGRLDVLVNNASQFYPTDVGQTTEKAWNELMGANLCAPFFLSQTAYPSLKETEGCIINLLDVHGERPLAGHSVYCISKAGLQMCTLALAKDFAPCVRVNAVAPGAILWPSTDPEYGDAEMCKKQESILEKIPFGRRGEPINIADTVLFLASCAGYITGQVINVDGGRTLNQ